MKFTVVKFLNDSASGYFSRAFLLTDDWDDMFEFSTMYLLVVFDEGGNRRRIGKVKIGQFGMEKGQRSADVPDQFENLDDSIFSLGQDVDYYEGLNFLGAELRDEVLRALNDVAANAELFERAIHENVTRISLLRYVHPETVRGQFRRMTAGGARLTDYHFEYHTPESENQDSKALFFEVRPESAPPSNVHVLIGRNGAGKTHLLRNMAQAIMTPKEEYGSFSIVDPLGGIGGGFVSLVWVSFSAFDVLFPREDAEAEFGKGIPCSYIGLKNTIDSDAAHKEGLSSPKSPVELEKEFVESLLACRQDRYRVRWQQALKVLEIDPVLSAAGVSNLAAENEEISQKEAARFFRLLSSGQRIVLLTIARLVETVAERTLVLIDEPEAHLHPPLLSAFIRALSELLVHRNGVAIVATHSPVVLQEVPRDCVWLLRRSGRDLAVERPGIETFGENVGVLTREAFGLEVVQAGFHAMIHRQVEEGKSFDQIVRHFGDSLGSEARAILQGLVVARDAIEGDLE